MPDAPDPSMIELLRRDAFEEIERVAYKAEDYARMLFDAAERGDLMETAGRLQQFRLCTINMIQTFNHFLRERLSGQDGEPRGDRHDQRPGDGVA